MNNNLIAMALGLMLSTASVSFAESTENKDSAAATHEAVPATDEKKPNEAVSADHKEMKDHAAPHDEAKKKKKKGGHRKGHHPKKSKNAHKTEEHHDAAHEHKAAEGDAKKAEHAAEPMPHEASPDKKD
ncbi:MAG: hypothetical protein ACRCUQ_02550 [Alphaproteobacteria bacterium]